MELAESIYWQKAPGEWVNLVPYLQRKREPGPFGGILPEPDPDAVYVGRPYGFDQRDSPGIRDALDNLRRRHPRARVEPPYRVADVLLRQPGPNLFDEITIAADDGFFVGFVHRIEASPGEVVCTLIEAGSVLAKHIV